MAYFVFEGYVPIRKIVVKADTEEKASECVDRIVSTSDIVDLVGHMAEVQLCSPDEVEECELCELYSDIDVIDLIGNDEEN